jgi:hypothetical protein
MNSSQAAGDIYFLPDLITTNRLFSDCINLSLTKSVSSNILIHNKSFVKDRLSDFVLNLE